MKNLFKKSLLTTASVLIALAATHDVSAQTTPVVATATVLNNLTLATAQELNFGTFSAIGNASTNVATVVVNAVTGAVTVTSDAPALAAVVDDSAATAAQITIADGAPGATINVTINAVVDPVNGGEAFTLGGFFTSLNGAAAVSRTATTPFTITYDGAFGGGTNTLDIGASLTTVGVTGAYTDNTYLGGFNVVFAY